MRPDEFFAEGDQMKKNDPAVQRVRRPRPSSLVLAFAPRERFPENSEATGARPLTEEKHHYLGEKSGIESHPISAHIANSLLPESARPALLPLALPED